MTITESTIVGGLRGSFSPRWQRWYPCIQRAWSGGGGESLVIEWWPVECAVCP